jgi:hypothetical protein
MHEPRHESLLREQWHRKPEHGPPVGIATLASHAIPDQVNNGAVVEPDYPGASSTMTLASLRIELTSAEVDAPYSCEQNPAATMQKRQQYQKRRLEVLPHNASDIPNFPLNRSEAADLAAYIASLRK